MKNPSSQSESSQSQSESAALQQHGLFAAPAANVPNKDPFSELSDEERLGLESECALYVRLQQGIFLDDLMAGVSRSRPFQGCLNSCILLQPSMASVLPESEVLLSELRQQIANFPSDVQDYICKEFKSIKTLDSALKMIEQEAKKKFYKLFTEIDISPDYLKRQAKILAELDAHHSLTLLHKKDPDVFDSSELSILLDTAVCCFHVNTARALISLGVDLHANYYTREDDYSATYKGPLFCLIISQLEFLPHLLQSVAHGSKGEDFASIGKRITLKIKEGFLQQKIEALVNLALEKGVNPDQVWERVDTAAGNPMAQRNDSWPEAINRNVDGVLETTYKKMMNYYYYYAYGLDTSQVTARVLCQAMLLDIEKSAASDELSKAIEEIQLHLCILITNAPLVANNVLEEIVIEEPSHVNNEEEKREEEDIWCRGFI